MPKRNTLLTDNFLGEWFFPSNHVSVFPANIPVKRSKKQNKTEIIVKSRSFHSEQPLFHGIFFSDKR